MVRLNGEKTNRGEGCKIEEKQNVAIDFQRIRAIPNKNRFDIKPIRELIKQE